MHFLLKIIFIYLFIQIDSIHKKQLKLYLYCKNKKEIKKTQAIPICNLNWV
jgi:hypothetical protein